MKGLTPKDRFSPHSWSAESVPPVSLSDVLTRFLSRPRSPRVDPPLGRTEASIDLVFRPVQRHCSYRILLISSGRWVGPPHLGGTFYPTSDFAYTRFQNVKLYREPYVSQFIDVPSSKSRSVFSYFYTCEGPLNSLYIYMPNTKSRAVNWRWECRAVGGMPLNMMLYTTLFICPSKHHFTHFWETQVQLPVGSASITTLFNDHSQATYHKLLIAKGMNFYGPSI